MFRKSILQLRKKSDPKYHRWNLWSCKFVFSN